MKKIILTLGFLLPALFMWAQSKTNYDETKVPLFAVPDPLVTFSGDRISDSTQWEKERRPELLDFFGNRVYGQVPGKLGISSVEIIEEGKSSFYEHAYRQQVKVWIEKGKHKLAFTLLIYLPENKTNVPVFLSANFYGNHSVTFDKDVIIPDSWAKNKKEYHISNNIFTEASRGTRADRWSIQRILDAGFGLATFYYGDIDPDKNDFCDGIHSFFYTNEQIRPEPHQWGSIAAWAWGLSRALDYLETNKRVDAAKVIALGHSRLGKTALWAGATDQRFSAVISNNSGCSGAALSKRCYGERIHSINHKFPHWFCFDYKKYNENEARLPVDQHELIALIAPRPVYIASAEKDRWADPRGEFLSAYYATSVYKLFGKTGITSRDMPPIEQPIQNTVAYHIRKGVHYVTDYDWEQYIKWASRMWQLADSSEKKEVR
uniref:alpha/beta hydrolase n=1 Tax=uncultured Draconibacterium sp. TaxID=1573823 RepID=UPI0032162EB6